MPPFLVDTHVHLNHDDVAADLPAVLERAEAAGVRAFWVVGWDCASSERAVALAESDPRIWATVGIHPHHAEDWSAEVAAALRGWAAHPRVLAIGEIGLDFYRDLSPRDTQRAVFAVQLDIAEETRLPVVIHCRDAYDETLDLLEDRGERLTGVLLHCFQGEITHAERAWKRGWYLGIGGAVTFKNQEGLREIVRSAPRDRILLETDAPYLSPVPLRGKYPNEPARVALVAQYIADLWETDTETVASLTTANASRFAPADVC